MTDTAVRNFVSPAPADIITVERPAVPRPSLYTVINWLYKRHYLPLPGRPALMGIALDGLPVMMDLNRPVDWHIDGNPGECRWLLETIRQSARMLNPGVYDYTVVGITSMEDEDCKRMIYALGNGIFSTVINGERVVFAVPVVE